MQARTTYREKALRYDGTASGGTVNTYTWNARNQLTQISQGGNAQLSFSYDALGRRMSKTVQSTATQFLYDGDNAVQETQGSTVNPILVGLGIDERFARNDVTGRTYFLVDQLNSTIALTDPNGVVKQQYSYDPYGNVTPSDTTTGFTNPYQYTGREADAPGLYYYRARYYSPQLLGFISEDPITFGGGQLSFYAYVGSDPIDFNDPFGLRPGDAFSTAHAAAFDVLSYINPTSISKNREFGGLIYRSNGCYYATMPVPGDYHTSNPFRAGHERMPKDGFPVGDYHTHANYSHFVNGVNVRTTKANSYYDNDNFSDVDMVNSATAAGIIDGWQSYLGTPSGNFYYYDAHVGAQQPLTP